MDIRRPPPSVRIPPAPCVPSSQSAAPNVASAPAKVSGITVVAQTIAAGEAATRRAGRRGRSPRARAARGPPDEEARERGEGEVQTALAVDPEAQEEGEEIEESGRAREDLARRSRPVVEVHLEVEGVERVARDMLRRPQEGGIVDVERLVAEEDDEAARGEGGEEDPEAVPPRSGAARGIGQDPFRRKRSAIPSGSGRRVRTRARRSSASAEAPRSRASPTSRSKRAAVSQAAGARSRRRTAKSRASRAFPEVRARSARRRRTSGCPGAAFSAAATASAARSAGPLSMRRRADSMRKAAIPP